MIFCNSGLTVVGVGIVRAGMVRSCALATLTKAASTARNWMAIAGADFDIAKYVSGVVEGKPKMPPHPRVKLSLSIYRVYRNSAVTASFLSGLSLLEFLHL